MALICSKKIKNKQNKKNCWVVNDEKNNKLNKYKLNNNKVERQIEKQVP